MPRKTQFKVDVVVETTFDMVRKNGWEGLSVTAVAKQMGCSTMPIYSHFENLETLKDEVIRKGWELVKDYEAKQYTGDAWVNQAIGYVYFARENSQLFGCMFDGRNLELQRRMLQEHWDFLTKLLSGYQGFKDLSQEQSRVIRYSRAMFTHGVATTVSKGWSKLLTDEEIITKYLAATSQAMLDGYRKFYDSSGGEVPFLDQHFQPLGNI